jgi:hypothetical protein
MRISSTSERQYPTEQQRQENTERLANFARSLEPKKPISIEEFKMLEASIKPASTTAAIEPKPAPLHPELQKLLEEINSPEYRDSQALKELESLHDRSQLWDVIGVRDAIEKLGITIYAAAEISADSRHRLGMSLYTGASADASNKRIIIDCNAIYRGCDHPDLRIGARAGLSGALLHEGAHVLLGHQGSENLSQLDRLSREDMAWALAEKLHSDHCLHGYIQDWQLRKMARFSINSHIQAAA